MADGAKSAENNETIDQPTKTNNGEESFKDEIKDYAKSTMNELLGMFGYDDEITSESVNNLDIKVPSSGEPVNPVSNTVTATASTSSSIITPSISSIPINALDDMSDDVPVIVKVEGNTSVTDIIRKQNENSSNQTISAQVPIQSQPLTTVELPQTCQSTPVTMTTKPQTSQATLAPHFYAAPPAVRGVYCVVANLPLAVNQSKSAMAFKFWNCITCSEYFLEKPEIVFRVHYPHLFTGQPEWLYQAAVCVKCYDHLTTTSEPTSTEIPASQAQGTFTVVSCTTKNDSNATNVFALNDDRNTGNISHNGDVPSSNEKPLECHGKPHQNNGKPVECHTKPLECQENPVECHTKPLEWQEKPVESYGKPVECTTSPLDIVVSEEPSSKNASTDINHKDENSNTRQVKQNQISVITSTAKQTNFDNNKCKERNHTPSQDNDSSHNASDNCGESSLETANDNDESYPCYVCQSSVIMTSQHSKIRRSKFPSLFTDVPDNVGHFKVCQDCSNHLHRQRDIFIKANLPDNQREYFKTSKLINNKSANDLCFICEITLNNSEPSKQIHRSKFLALFHGLPGHTTHLSVCIKCYKRLHYVKLRYDSTDREQDARQYVEFVNLWRALDGLGIHPILV